MKYTLCVTHRCNFACDYCYVGKREATMSLATAGAILDFIFARTPADERIIIGYFGGEPLLEFNLLEAITSLIEQHSGYDPDRVELHLVTNGSIFTSEVADFVLDHNICFGVSCDGPPEVQDVFRRFRDGRSSARTVEENLRAAVASLPLVMVNAVHHPGTFRRLTHVVDYFAGLGITQIYLTPDYTAEWTAADTEELARVYEAVADRYIESYRRTQPLYISPIDSKIAVVLRGGFAPLERCRMGVGELAFSPEGNVYPCERLIGDGRSEEHCLGNVFTGVHPERMACRKAPGHEINPECLTCGIREYCMNWCGCTNYMATGRYNRVSGFLCRTEQMTIRAALRAFETLERELGPTFHEHLAGRPAMNSLSNAHKSQ